jgi:hypothetical protein
MLNLNTRIISSLIAEQIRLKCQVIIHHASLQKFLGPWIRDYLKNLFWEGNSKTPDFNLFQPIHSRLHIFHRRRRVCAWWVKG